jgi:hypothetical protein
MQGQGAGSGQVIFKNKAPAEIPGFWRAVDARYFRNAAVSNAAIIQTPR